MIRFLIALLLGALLMSSQALAQSRTKLTADTTYTVCSSGCDFTSIGDALTNLSENIDGGGKFVSLQLSAGTYDKPGHYIRPMVGVAGVFVKGSSISKQLVKLKSTTSEFLFQIQEQTGGPNIRFQDMTIDITGLSGCGFGAFQQTNLILHNIRWEGSGSAVQCALVTTVANVLVTGSHEWVASGASTFFANLGDLGFLSLEALTFSIIGTPTIQYFAQFYRGGVLSAQGVTFVNGANLGGAQYVFNGPGFLDLGGITGVFPGNAALNWNDGKGVIRKANYTYEPGGITGVKTLSKPLGTCTITFQYGLATASTC